MCEDLGWENIGGGMGRTVWRVSSDLQEGDMDATIEGPCVVKFAVNPGAPYPGRGQNREEIAQFKKFPEAITTIEEGEIPVVVPISDWDEDDYLWLSAPEVEPGGSKMEAETRLAEHGWTCEDLHFDNFGVMHDTTVVLDYGLECESGNTPLEQAHETKEWLERSGMRDVTVHENDPGATVKFWPPDWVIETTEPPAEKSSVLVDEKGDMSYMNVVVASYPLMGEDDPAHVEHLFDPDLMSASETVADEFDGTWFGMHTHAMPIASGTIWSIRFEVEMGPVDGDYDPPDIIADKVEDLLDYVHEHFPGGETHDMPDFLTPLDPEEGMFLDHPDIPALVKIVDVDADGNVMAEDSEGLEYNLRLSDYQPLTRDFLVEGPDVEVQFDPEQLDLEESIARVIEEQVEDEEAQEEITAAVDEAIDQRDLTEPGRSSEIEREIEEEMDDMLADMD